VAAKTSCEQNVVTPALSHVVEANTLLSGLGFESGGLASAHSIHNGLTRLAGTHPFYHGEKVTIGLLAGLFLADRPSELIDDVYDFCESVGLPTTLSAIGIGEANDDQLRAVAEAACVRTKRGACENSRGDRIDAGRSGNPPASGEFGRYPSLQVAPSSAS
jgi:glycerol dehydrogenase